MGPRMGPGESLQDLVPQESAYLGDVGEGQTRSIRPSWLSNVAWSQ